MNADPSFAIFPLGDSALVVSYGNVIDVNINKKILSLYQKLTQVSLPGIKDIVPAYASLAVHYDVVILQKKNPGNRSSFEIMSDLVKKIAEENVSVDLPESRKIKVPVCYGGKYALDINDIAAEKKLTLDEIIKLHTAGKYRVYMIGFLPGFAYMGEVDERIAIPRKAQPRLNIEAGSVGIAGKQTGIYPLTSPGGWQIIGRTPLKLFDKEAVEPVLFRAGDEVEFYSISEDEFRNY